VFEQTLWSADVMFEYVKIGAVGVNFHSNDWNSFNQWDAYAAFHFYATFGAFSFWRRLQDASSTRYILAKCSTMSMKESERHLLSSLRMFFQQSRHQCSPPSLVTGPDAPTGITVEILIEENQILPGWVFRVDVSLAVHGPPARSVF
jgi:hypothetical protein